MNLPGIVVLTGAGISAESGIQTFRAEDGLWADHRIEDVATPEGYARNPALVQTFYNQRRQQLQDPAIVPNAAHLALFELEQRLGNRLLVVTQNVDDLHERAGQQNLIHMHGALKQMRCTVTAQVFAIDTDINAHSRCPCCDRSGTLRPHIVWFGEMPLQMAAIDAALKNADLFVAIGTSGNVYPAAGFVAQASAYGAQTLEINLAPSVVNNQFDQSIIGLATECVPRWVDRLISGLS